MSTAATVRRATAEDVAEIVQVAAATFSDACPPTTTEAAKAEHIATQLNADVIGGWVRDGRTEVLVAQGADGRILGYAMAELQPEPEAAVVEAAGEEPVGCLSKIYLLEQARGTGAADALMVAAEQRMREHGCALAWLGTNTENARANAFYARHGYEIVGRRTFLVGGRPETDWTRLKRLSG